MEPVVFPPLHVTRPASTTAISNGPNHVLDYEGQTSQVFGIWIINLLLNIITFGIYSFWGKTRLRRYLIGSFKLLGDHFEYTGRGKELFIGFLKALPIIIIVYLPFLIWEPEQNPIVNVMWLVIMFLVTMAVYTSMRYRFSRTLWRGIRGKLTGSALEYALLKSGCWLMKVFTLGLLAPYADLRTFRYMMDHTSFGNAKAIFTGTPSKLMLMNVMTILLFIPTFGMSRVWYRGALLNEQYNNISFGSIKLKSTHSGSNYITQTYVNWTIFALTLGLGTPIIIQRKMRYFSRHVSLVGDIEGFALEQAQGKVPATGEGLEDAMDADMGAFF